MGFRILKRDKYFYVRIWVPLDVRAILRRSELKKSLRTSNRSEARVLASGLLHKAETIFMQVRSGMLTNRQLEILAGELISEFTAASDKSKKERPAAFEALEEGLPIGLNANWDLSLIVGMHKYTKPKSEVLELSANYQARLDWLSDELMTGQYSDYTRSIAKNLVTTKGLDVVIPPVEWFNENDSAWNDEPPADFGRLCESVVAALRTSYQLEHERINGNTDSALRRDTLARIEATLPKPKLSDLWEGYKAIKLAKGKWNGKTIANYLRFYNETSEILGDKELAQYGQDDALKLLAVLTKNHSNTATGKIEFLSSMFKFALKTPESIDRWKVRGNPFTEMQVSGGTSSGREVVPYSQDDLVKLFTGLLKVRKRVEPHRFWVPLVAFYSGMRQEEVCQLRTVDIKDDNGIRVFHICHNPELNQTNKGKKLKVCPIHPMLLRLGFGDYVDKQLADRHDRLFHTLNHSVTKGYTGMIRSWWNESYQGKHLEDTTGKSFHSMRHNFVDWFKQNGCYTTYSDRSLIQAMIGHVEGDVTGVHYEEDYSSKEKLRMLKKLDYGIDPELIEKLAKKEY